MKVCKELCYRVRELCEKMKEMHDGSIADVYVMDYSESPWKEKLLYQNAIVLAKYGGKRKEHYIQKPDGIYLLPRKARIKKKVVYARDVESGECKKVSGKCEECD